MSKARRPSKTNHPEKRDVVAEYPQKKFTDRHLQYLAWPCVPPLFGRRSNPSSCWTLLLAFFGPLSLHCVTRQVISDAWARCRFETQGDGSDSGALMVVDRASDQNLGVYHATAVTIGSLAALRPTENRRA